MNKRIGISSALGLLLIFALVLLTYTSLAQGPDLNNTIEPMGTTNPTTMLYQGYVEVGGRPYHGKGYFKFSVVNQQGNVTYWANDGSVSGQPNASVPLDVTQGYFTVLLGHTELNGMSKTMTPQVFAGPGRYLKVWFATASSSTFVQLGPIPIGASPYALNAETLDGKDSSQFAGTDHLHDSRYYTQDALKNTGQGAQVHWSNLRYLPSGFADGVDHDTRYSAGLGLTLVGTTFSADTSRIQSRVGSTCPSDYAIREIKADGTVTCQPVWTGDITAVYAGTCLTGGGASDSVTLNIDPNCAQRRVTQSCPTGNAIRAIHADGTVTCQPIGSSVHDHWGETWSGSGTGLALKSSNGIGLSSETSSTSSTTSSIQGNSTAAARGVTGSSARGHGVYGSTAANPDVDADNASGVFGHSTTAARGVSGFSAQGHGVHGWSNSTDSNFAAVRGHAKELATGVSGYSENGTGVFGETESTNNLQVGVFGRNGGTGVGVQAVAESNHALYATSNSDSLSHFGGYFLGPKGVYARTDTVDGDAVYAQASQSGGWAVRAESQDSFGVYAESGASAAIYAETGRTDNNYGLYSPDNIYSLNFHSAAGLSLIAQNGGPGDLERGDLVIVSGIAAPLHDSGVPLLVVRRAESATTAAAVIGVVETAYQIEFQPNSDATHPTEKDSQTALQPGAVKGPVKPGQLLVLKVQGLAQVKVEAMAAAVQPGDPLTVSTEGRATSAANVTAPDEMPGYSPASSIGRALEPVSSGQGLIWALIDLR